MDRNKIKCPYELVKDILWEFLIILTKIHETLGVWLKKHNTVFGVSALVSPTVGKSVEVSSN